MTMNAPMNLVRSGLIRNANVCVCPVWICRTATTIDARSMSGTMTAATLVSPTWRHGRGLSHRCHGSAHHQSVVVGDRCRRRTSSPPATPLSFSPTHRMWLPCMPRRHISGPRRYQQTPPSHTSSSASGKHARISQNIRAIVTGAASGLAAGLGLWFAVSFIGIDRLWIALGPDYASVSDSDGIDDGSALPNSAAETIDNVDASHGRQGQSLSGDASEPGGSSDAEVTTTITAHGDGRIVRLNARSLFMLISRPITLSLFAIRAFLRMMYLAAVFGPLVIGLPIWIGMEHPRLDTDTNVSPPRRLWWIHWLVWSFEAAGPTFIKLGQWASSRADLFPPYICEALSKLQANVLPHAYAYTERSIWLAFGLRIEDLFLRFDRDPIGCGAIAQVYYAELKPGVSGAPEQLAVELDASDSSTDDTTGHTLAMATTHGSHLSESRGIPCAVKVLHPGVRDLIMFDLAILSLGAKIIDAVVPGAQWLSFPEEVAVFGSMMRAQLDLSKEAMHLQTFHDNFENWSSVGFPLPVHGLVTRDVLVENYIEAVPMTKFLTFGSGTTYDKELAKIGLTTFLKMLILDNLVHADLHPGNILVTFHRAVPSSPLTSQHVSKDGLEFVDPAVLQKLRDTTDPDTWATTLSALKAQNYVPFMYIVDTGLVSSISPTHFRNFLDLFQAITEFNGRLIGQLMIERSTSPWTVIDPEGFSQAMTRFIRRIRTQTFTLQHVRVADILGFVLSQVRQHHVKIEGDFANVAISIMLLEGMGRRLEPSMDLLRASVPFLREAFYRRMEGHVSRSEVSFWRMVRAAVWNLLFRARDQKVDRERQLQ